MNGQGFLRNPGKRRGRGSGPSFGRFNLPTFSIRLGRFGNIVLRYFWPALIFRPSAPGRRAPPPHPLHGLPFLSPGLPPAIAGAIETAAPAVLGPTVPLVLVGAAAVLGLQNLLQETYLKRLQRELDEQEKELEELRKRRRAMQESAEPQIAPPRALALLRLPDAAAADRSPDATAARRITGNSCGRAAGFAGNCPTAPGNFSTAPPNFSAAGRRPAENFAGQRAVSGRVSAANRTRQSTVADSLATAATAVRATVRHAWRRGAWSSERTRRPRHGLDTVRCDRTTISVCCPRYQSEGRHEERLLRVSRHAHEEAEKAQRLRERFLS